MRIEDLTVALRPRSPWEAVELGSALVRRHAAAVWKPWFALSLPLFALLNLLSWSIDIVWLAPILMWWLKPFFDRVPLYVLSRAVFGHVPGTWQTLRAQFTWGLRWMPAYLLWRRLGPVRSLYLPVDLLEGGVGEEARARRSALGSPVYGVAALVLVVFVHFEMALSLGLVFGAAMLIPWQVLQESLPRVWEVFEAQPLWLQFGNNTAIWLATSVLEPFYVGAGFGLYLNRRTEIEAWDIEMVLRRLRTRLTQSVAPTVLLCALWLGAWPNAQAADDEPRTHAPSCPAVETSLTAGASNLQEIFGPDLVDDAGWRQAMKRTYEDPQVSPQKRISHWVPKDPKTPKPQRERESSFAKILAVIGEYGLWILFGLVALAIVLTAPRWGRWLRDTTAREQRERSEVQHQPMAPPAPLPDDVPTAARRLWHGGHQRDALALVYRASVASMVERAQVVLIPGATEAHTLRASRQMPRAEDRDVFARAVRVWQVAAYAHGLPSLEEFEDLLQTLTGRFAWTSAGGQA